MILLSLPPTLRTDVQEVDRIVRERTHARAAVISAADPSLLQPDEVRLRAVLVLLAAQVGTYTLSEVLPAAAAVELIYAATRTHNDLVDEAERRRGNFYQGDWEHGISLMVGDYLFALAAGEMSRSPDPRVISAYSQAVMRICESQLAPVPLLQPLEQAREHYFAHTGGAAAALYAAACRAGAACGGLPSDQIETLAEFGYAFGLAQRIAAEIRDVSPDGGTGESLRRGVVTLPLILAAATGDGARLELALDAAGADHAWALAEVRTHGLVPAHAELVAHISAAKAALSGLPLSPARSVLEQLADASQNF